MTIQIRNVGGKTFTNALVPSYNALRGTVAAAASKFHADVTAQPTVGDWDNPPSPSPMTITAANASDLASSIALANQLKAFFNVHIADTFAHAAADTANPVSTANASDLTSTEALLNAIKTAFNAHLTQASVHFTNDATNGVSTANATDQTTSNALANALKGAFNAHIQGAVAGASIQLISA